MDSWPNTAKAYFLQPTLQNVFKKYILKDLLEG